MGVEQGRPTWHPTAPAGWMSDPNGPVFWDGLWHVFYQHNPAAPVWGLMHWGHLTTPDLATWTDHGIALAPRPGMPDADGCWSGCIRVIDGEPVAFYTGTRGSGPDQQQVVLRARATPDLEGFAPDPSTPIIVPDRAEAGTRHQRDPFLLHHDGEWVMLLGTGTPEQAGAVVAWRSVDTRTWRYAGVVFSPPRSDDPVDTGPVWECPQLTRLGDDWVLIVSVQLPGIDGAVCPYALWFVGDFDGERFTERSRGLIDGGRVVFAPTIATGDDGRELLWAWVQESTEERAAPRRSWAGTMSTPRQLAIVDGHLVTRPAIALEERWRRSHAATGMRAERGSPIPVPVPDTPDFRLRIAGTGDWSAELGRDGAGRRVRVSALSEGAPAVLRIELVDDVGASRVLAECPAGVDTGDTWILVDASIVEAFWGGAAVTARVDPELRPEVTVSAVHDRPVVFDLAVDVGPPTS